MIENRAMHPLDDEPEGVAAAKPRLPRALRWAGVTEDLRFAANVSAVAVFVAKLIKSTGVGSYTFEGPIEIAWLVACGLMVLAWCVTQVAPPLRWRSLLCAYYFNLFTMGLLMMTPAVNAVRE